jgi:hypothetical protein
MNTEDTDFTPPSDEGTDPARDRVPADRRPLGFWLRTVDGLLTRAFAEAFAGAGIDRRDWMLLNALSGDVAVPGLAERLARKGKRLRGLADRGWAEESGDGTWVLTDDGRAARERLSGIVDGIRSQVSSAVSPADYATTMASLEAIARDFGWEEGQRMPRRGSGRGFRPGGGFGPEAGFGPGGEFGPGRGGCRRRHRHGEHGDSGHDGHSAPPHHGHDGRSRGPHDHGRCGAGAHGAHGRAADVA